MNVLSRSILALVLALGSGAATTADAPASTGNIDAHAEVAAVLYAASATQAAMAKSVDARLRSQQDRIDALAAELKAGDTRHRAEMTAAQEAFIAELATKDRQYATQIALFRGTVTDIASTSEGASALERFNAGDEVGAIAILDRLRATNERMREARARLEDAAEGRRIAQLALEARTRGKLTTQAVIARFEEVVRLDAGVGADWLELNRLYQDAGRLTDARKAVDSLAAAAHNDNDRAIAFSARSEVLLAQGDLAGGRKAGEQAVTMSRRLLSADPKNPDVQYTFSHTLISLGEVARRQGDLVTAQKCYVEEIAFARSRILADPANERSRRILASDLLHLADVLIALGDLPGARTALEENLGIQRAFAAQAPDNIVVPRQIAVTLMWLSDTLIGQGAFAEARKANAEIVATASRLVAADPANAILQRDLSFGFTKTAFLQRIEGDFDGSLENYERALQISRQLALSESASLDVKQDVATGLYDLAHVKYLKQDFDGARQAADEGAALLRTLVAADATDAISQQFLANALYHLGDALTAKADYAGARKAYEQGLALDLALAGKNADAAEVQNDTSFGKLGMGKLLNKQGNHAAALTALGQSLDIRRRLAASHPGSSSVERGVAEVMRALLDTPGSKVGWPHFRTQVEDMERKGILWPADRAWLEEARQHASSGATP
jgi:tetratricopeptide (TPR) repeat protein